MSNLFASRVRKLKYNTHFYEDKLKEAGLSEEALTEYENGEKTPDIALLMKLSNTFHVSIDYLACNDMYRDLYEDNDSMCEHLGLAFDCLNDPTHWSESALTFLSKMIISRKFQIAMDKASIYFGKDGMEKAIRLVEALEEYEYKSFPEKEREELIITLLKSEIMTDIERALEDRIEYYSTVFQPRYDDFVE